MRKPDPVEIVAVTVPLLCEAVAVLFAIAVAVMWVALLSNAAPA